MADMTFIERDEMDGHNPAIVITRGGRALTWDEVTRLVQILNSPSVSATIVKAWRESTGDTGCQPVHPNPTNIQ